MKDKVLFTGLTIPEAVCIKFSAPCSALFIELCKASNRVPFSPPYSRGSTEPKLPIESHTIKAILAIRRKLI